MIFKEQNKTNSKDTTIDLGLVKGNGHCVEVREKKKIRSSCSSIIFQKVKM